MNEVYEWVLALLLIPVLALFDRVRGGQRFGLTGTKEKILKYIAQFGLGLFPAYLLTDEPVLWVLGSVLFWVGEKPSWRGIYNELSGITPERPRLFLRFMLRGLVWACLPMLLVFAQVFYFDEPPSFLAYGSMVLAMPIGSYWGYRWQSTFPPHAFAEWSRGALLGGFICLFLLAWSLFQDIGMQLGI
jgi:hypothetical protein